MQRSAVSGLLISILRAFVYSFFPHSFELILVSIAIKLFHANANLFFSNSNKQYSMLLYSRLFTHLRRHQYTFFI